MVNQKAQVTVFIIVGIVILFLSAIIFYLVSLGQTQDLEIAVDKPVEVSSLKFFVDKCLEKSAIDGIYKVFSQGGYNEIYDLETLNYNLNDQSFELPYYFINQQTTLPSLNTIESETAQAAKSSLLACLNNFNNYRQQGYEINGELNSLSINFLDDKTVVELSYPLIIKKEDYETSFDLFAIDLDFDFVKKYNALKQFLTEQQQNPQDFLVGDLSMLAYENNYLLGFEQFADDGSEVLIDFTFPEKLKEEPLNYNFALNYDWEPEPPIEVNLPEPSLQLLRLSDWKVTTPGLNYYQVNALGEGLSYFIDNQDMNIDHTTGLITLNADEFSNNEYLYYVGVMDKNNREVLAPLIINVNVE